MYGGTRDVVLKNKSISRTTHLDTSRLAMNVSYYTVPLWVLQVGVPLRVLWGNFDATESRYLLMATYISYYAVPVRTSHITQYPCRYCKPEYRWGYYEETLMLLNLDTSWWLRTSHITQYPYVHLIITQYPCRYCKPEYRWGYYEETLMLLNLDTSWWLRTSHITQYPYVHLIITQYPCRYCKPEYHWGCYEETLMHAQ